MADESVVGIESRDDMGNGTSGAFDWFWDESVWLPPGHTWSLLHEASGVQLSDLYWSGLTALALLLIRSLIERFIFNPIGSTLFGLKDRTKRNKQFVNSVYSIINSRQRNILDTTWKEKKNVLTSFDQKSLSVLLKSINEAAGSGLKVSNQEPSGQELDQRQLERWIRRKANSERCSTMSKFTESMWRMTFYAFAFGFGLWTLSDKPWLTNSIESIAGYPYHPVGNREWCYYNLELGFYLSLIISQFTDVPKKDFYQMFIHHLVTILLLTFSWACNFVRIGTLVLVIHDFADIPLEGAKICRYIQASDLVSNSVFGLFTLSWIFSRLGLLPARVIAYTSWYGLQVIHMFPAYYIFNALLISLQFLHVVWTILILRIAYNAIYADGVKDLREDSSLSSASTSSQLTPSDGENETEKDDPFKPSKDAGDGLLRRRINQSNTPVNNGSKTGNVNGSKTGNVNGSKTGSVNLSKTGNVNGSKTGNVNGSKTGNGDPKNHFMVNNASNGGATSSDNNYSKTD